MNAQALVKQAERELRALASPSVAQGMQRYFKDAVPFLGVKMPSVQAYAREHVLPSLAKRECGVDDAGAAGIAFLRAREMELKAIGVMVLERRRRELADAFIDGALAPLFDEGHVADWATCDAIAMGVLREMVKRPAPSQANAHVIAWSRAKCTWRQRAAAVAFANDARHGANGDDVVAVCERVVRTQERYAQLGCGWALRELALADRARVLQFLDEHAALITREALRYATAKMPADVRAKALARHAIQTGKGRVRGVRGR